MKTKAKGLEARLEITTLCGTNHNGYDCYWRLYIKGGVECVPRRIYTNPRGARSAAFRFAEKLGISVEVVE